MTRPAIRTQSEAVGTLAVVAADGVAADAITDACSCIVTLIDIWESEEIKGEEEEEKKNFDLT